MNVRGWIMVGASSAGNGLPPNAYVGHWQGEPPPAGNFMVGQWLYWKAAPALLQVTLVCVEIPL